VRDLPSIHMSTSVLSALVRTASLSILNYSPDILSTITLAERERLISEI